MKNLATHAYEAAVGRFVGVSFPLWQKMGIHITRNHFYEPIPDTSLLSDELWQRPSAMPGVDLRDEEQQTLLKRFAIEWRGEYDQFPQERTGVAHQYYLTNGLFGPVDAEVLYCMIRHFKPKRLYEIGSGNSTYLSAHAIARNTAEGKPCELVAFEPYPNPTLREGFPGLSRLVARPVQSVPVSEFEALEANDILFIDSSHVLKIGSDVQYEFLEIIPRLKPGVIVHIHDIFLPAEPPKQWVVKQRRFWNEQYLLQAFLAFNSCFEVLWAGQYMHLAHPGMLKEAFGSYHASASPASFWIRRAR